MKIKPVPPAIFGIMIIILTLGLTAPLQAKSAPPKRDITIDDLISIRDISSMRLSPDGKYIAFQTVQRHSDRNDFTLQWYIAPTQAGATARIVDTGTEPFIIKPAGYLTGSTIAWTPDSKWIYYTKRKQDSIQVWRASLNTQQAQQITHKPGDIQSMRMGPDGKRLFFTLGRTHAEIEALKADGDRRGYLEQNPPLYYVSHGPMIPPCTDGKPRSKTFDKNLACLLTNWVYDIGAGSVRTAAQAELDALPPLDDTLDVIARMGIQMSKTVRKMQTPSPDGGRLAWIENADPEVYKGVFPLMALTATTADGTPLRCPAPECLDQDLVGFGGIWWHPNGREIIFKVNNDPHHSLTAFYGWTPGDQHVRPLLRSDDSLSGCQITGLQLICGQESWTSPKKIAALDLESGKLTPLIDVNPDFKAIRFTKVEKILGEDAYGHKVYGHLVYPKDYQKGKKYPLIVTQYHSYGFLRGATGHEQPIHAYARDGIAVLSFDHRLNRADYQKTAVFPGTNVAHFTNLHIKEGPATAVENMVDRLVARGIADPDHIGVTGFSYGDQVLSTMLLRRNYAAVSSAGPPSVPLHNVLPYSSNTAKAFAEIFGKPFSEKGLEMRVKYSLEAHASEIDSPILMNVTDKEVYSMLSVYYALTGEGKPVEMYTYPDEYHIKWQPAHNYWIYSRNLDWFNFWLRGAEDGAPEKSPQYERWRKLRESHETHLKRVKK
ncbi:Atxe2 family lasso peptide isopeptidase [Paremcibacter congregatus]|uniref:Atxe2 family lasso peptide isopeptidase n=1 Tax=Paremcibacter congregatus TaxID=2043170 RepID=UPI003A93053A